MRRALVPLIAFWTRCRRGATAVEYALLASLIALAIFGGISSSGGKLLSMFYSVGSRVP